MPNDAVRSFSRLCDTLAWLDDRLQVAAWPPHEVTGIKPAVGVGDSFTGVPTGNETVDIVMGSVEPGQTTIAWTRVSPAGRDEVFPLEVDIRTMVPGRSRRQALDRFRELSEPVQAIFYDPQTYEVTAAGEADWSVKLGGVTSVAVELVPFGDEGWVAYGMVASSATCRI